MDLIGRKDLEGRGAYEYTWTTSPGDNPKIIGKPDSDRVSKKEGYEVVDFINAFAKKYNLSSIKDAFKIEDMIHATDEMMRINLNFFVYTNWNTWGNKVI